MFWILVKYLFWSGFYIRVDIEFVEVCIEFF